MSDLGMVKDVDLESGTHIKAFLPQIPLDFWATLEKDVFHLVEGDNKTKS